MAEKSSLKGYILALPPVHFIRQSYFKWKQKAVGVNSMKCYVTFTYSEMFLMLFLLNDQRQLPEVGFRFHEGRATVSGQNCFFFFFCHFICGSHSAELFAHHHPCRSPKIVGVSAFKNCFSSNVWLK